MSLFNFFSIFLLTLLAGRRTGVLGVGWGGGGGGCAVVRGGSRRDRNDHTGEILAYTIVSFPIQVVTFHLPAQCKLKVSL